MTSPPASAVVVTHDTRGAALACISSLQAAGADEIVLVDAGSRDRTASVVRARHPEVIVLELDNAGFGRAANAGVRRATHEMVVICNADVRFGDDALDRLVGALAARDDVGAVGPRVEFPSGDRQASARRLPGPVTAAGHAVLGWARPANRFTRRYRAADVPADVPRDADWLSGCALAVRRTAFEEVGGFDPGYFLYVEDVDLSLRLRGAGWRVRYAPSASVVHLVGASTDAKPARATLAHGRSLARWYRRYASAPGTRILAPLVTAAAYVWAAGRAVGRRAAAGDRPSTGERVRRRGDRQDGDA